MEKHQSVTCPTCKKKHQSDFFPFCSKRCADIDLGKWLGGHYHIPGESIPQEELPTNDD